MISPESRWATAQPPGQLSLPPHLAEPLAACGGSGWIRSTGATRTSISPQLEDILQQDTGKAIPLVVAVDVAGVSRNKPET